MATEQLTHLSLFSGIDGIDLAAEWAGFETVGQVEKNEFCQKVLTKHWPGVPGWSDVRDVTEGDVRETIGEERFPPTLVSGGFPCQPFSTAGKRMGKEDDRDLWPKMFRVIRKIRPDWVLGENVANFANMGLERTVSDLENEDYQVRTFDIPACGRRAKHRRHRIFIVANSGGDIGTFRLRNRNGEKSEKRKKTKKKWCKNRFVDQMGPEVNTRKTSRKCFPESRLVGNNDGFPNLMDRIKSLGNAVVPQQVFPILQGIAEIEKK